MWTVLTSSLQSPPTHPIRMKHSLHDLYPFRFVSRAEAPKTPMVDLLWGAPRIGSLQGPGLVR